MFHCKNCHKEVGVGLAKCTNCGADVVENYEVDCISCGQLNLGGNRFCFACGALLPMIKKPICVICGTQNVPGAKFCSNCGGPILMTSDTHTEKDIIEQRKQKMRADLIEKERLTAVEAEVSKRRQKITQEELDSRESILFRASEFDVYIREKAKKLDNYKILLEESDSPDSQKLKKLSIAIRAHSHFLSEPLCELDEDEKEVAVYTCPVCGAENSLQSPICQACGRDKERTAYLLNKSKIVKMKDFGKMSKRYAQMPYSVDISDVPRYTIDDVPDDAKPLSQILGDEAYLADQKSLRETNGKSYSSHQVAKEKERADRSNADEPYQMPPIIQPVAFVPYVTQDQPLLQYAAEEDTPKKKKR